MEKKPFYLSKTLWINFILFAASLLVTLGLVQVPINPEASYVSIIITIVNMLLRIITGKELTT